MIEDYLEQIRVRLVTSIIVDEFHIVEEWNQLDEGYIRIRLKLSNGDFLEVAEYFALSDDGLSPIRYRYQWMDADQKHLRRRWDNVEHYPHLTNYPDHIHLSDGSVVPGERLGIVALLDLLEKALLG